MVAQRESESAWDPLAPHADVFAEYEELRGRCPVVHSSAFGGYWMFNRYEDVMAAALDRDTFASAPGPFIENDATNSLRSIPITLNRPEHTQYRRILDRYFLLKRVAAFEPTVQRLAKDQLAPFLAAGGGDFVRAVAYPFPARILCALLGLDDSMWATVKALGEASDNSREDREQRKKENEKFQKFIADIIAQRKAMPGEPSDDLLSGVIGATIDGAPIDDEVVERIVHQLFTAGHQTTSRALANGAAFLAADYELQDRLRKDSSLIPGAVEEFLRLRPPVHQIARSVACPVVVEDIAMHPGDRVVLNFASANRDEREFDSPNSLDITRAPNRHATFGSGIHKCLGAPVARLELRTVLGELLARTSKIEFAEQDAVEEQLRGGHFTSGFEVLPLRVTVKN